MTEVFDTGIGYKIEVASGEANVFTVMDTSGQYLESVQSIGDLVADKYITTDKIGELKGICDRVFGTEIAQLQNGYFVYQNETEFFNKFFRDIVFTYRLNKTFSKEIHKKMVDDIRMLIASKVSDKHLPISIADNKLEVIFTVNPVSYLKTFNTLYDKIMVDGNYSVISQALEMIQAVDFLHDLSIGIMTIADQYQ
jgi:hypothetical protein